MREGDGCMIGGILFLLLLLGFMYLAEPAILSVLDTAEQAMMGY